MSFHFPYLALDIETTGTDRQKAHILQLAAIYDNGRPLDELQIFNEVIHWEVLGYINEWALKHNRWLLERGLKRDNTLSVGQTRAQFYDFLYHVQPENRITLAGKNAGGFDLPILTNRVNDFALLERRVNRRVLDPGSMFAEDFDHIPNQTEINKFLGRASITHDALDDCWDVVHAVRYKWGVE